VTLQVDCEVAEGGILLAAGNPAADEGADLVSALRQLQRQKTGLAEKKSSFPLKHLQ